MVESAIIMVVFLMLVMGIIEFALLIFNASSLVEATRTGSRYLIVHDPVKELSSCKVEVVCSDTTADCKGVLDEMQRFYSPLTEDNLQITYRCSSTGYKGEDASDDYRVFEVEMGLVNVKYTFITPGILGLDTTITLPDFKTTRLSEDLESP